MITIQNVTPAPLSQKPGGVHDYELRINGRLIVRYSCQRKPDGLAACLRAAARAVDRARKGER